jgi:hypothetical protein
VYLKNGKLNLFNTFNFDSKEDFMYYVLYSIEQLNLNADSVDFKLLGDIKKGNELYDLIYTYVRNVSFGNNSSTIKISDAYAKTIQNHNHFSLINSF